MQIYTLMINSHPLHWCCILWLEETNVFVSFKNLKEFFGLLNEGFICKLNDNDDDLNDLDIQELLSSKSIIDITGDVYENNDLC